MVIGRGSGEKAAVREIQEWLCLSPLAPSVTVDGDYGPATELSVCMFQRANGLEDTGSVDAHTQWCLRQAFEMATGVISLPPGLSLGDTIVAVAKLHLEAGARELGGKNYGPWVRHYNGADGPAQAWCAGFVSTILRQAMQWADRPMPIKGSVSCDRLQAQAEDAGFYCDGRRTTSDLLAAGDFFLVRGSRPGDWVHTGIIEAVDESVIATIEGNSNDEGSREGREVCRRVRPLKGLDFISWAA